MLITPQQLLHLYHCMLSNSKQVWSHARMLAPPRSERRSMEKPLQLTEGPFIWRTEHRFTSGTNYVQPLYPESSRRTPPPLPSSVSIPLILLPSLFFFSLFIRSFPPQPVGTVLLYGSIPPIPSFILPSFFFPGTLLFHLTLLFLPVSLSICL